MTKKKVMAAMSGGVDSSVCAYLLQKKGYEVAGVTMCMGIAQDRENRGSVKCCGPDAVNDARRVCDQLGIPHYVLDFSKELEKDIIDDFIKEYSSGRTPNPCVRCNRFLKFGKLLDHARAMGFDHLATGHYARLEPSGGRMRLKRARDRKKDQTYFLYGIGRDLLDNILFPLGALLKEQVRDTAREASLAVAEKEQSQDLCFVDQGEFNSFINERTGVQRPGDIVDMEGNVVGRHNGIAGYTLGQRSGLGVAMGHPVYIVSINAQDNSLVVGKKEHLFSSTLTAEDVNLLVDEMPPEAWASIRYNSSSVPCRVRVNESKEAEVVFENPQRAVTPGQSIVFYKGNTVCGGGVIKRTGDDGTFRRET